MRKIGELKGKPIIEGNPNEIKKNQIHYKESDGGITLSERKEDNTLSSVTSGSGSGEGVKEYYYKCAINNNDEELLQMLNFFASCTNEFNVIISAPLYTDDGLHKGNTENYETICGLTNTLRSVYTSDNYVIGFRYKSRKFENYTIIESAWGPNIYASKHLGTANFTTLYDFFIEQGGPEEEVNALNAVFQEITKEEYESMITYKPE